MNISKIQKVLLSFIGMQDPGYSKEKNGPMVDGPILSLLSARNEFTDVILLHTPEEEMQDKGEKIVSMIKKRFNIQAQHLSLPIDDPTHYESILNALRQAYSDLEKKMDDVDFSIVVSSGTSQMQTCWLLLVASGEIRADLIQIREGKHVTKDRSLVTEINPWSQEFPDIQKKQLKLVDIPELTDQEVEAAIRESGIVGTHPKLMDALQIGARSTLYHAVPVLILGERGTGKELVADYIHKISKRRDKKMIPFHCGAIVETLAESTLFGYKRGSFTGANDDRDGLFDAADGGTLFLDEIGEMPINIQAKLLRVLQNSEITPIGETMPHRVNVRLITATNQNLKDEEKFRQDLYDRISKIIVNLPPLRVRRSDIPALAIHFLEEFNNINHTKKKLSPKTLSEIIHYPWKGNIRELQNAVESAAISTAGDDIDSAILMQADISNENNMDIITPEPYDGFSMDDCIEEVRRQLYEKAIQLSKNDTQAAALIGKTSTAVADAKKKYNIK